MKSSAGRAGCGCLMMLLVVFLVVTAAMMHPFSLRLLADRLTYKDAIVTSDAVLVPYFPEDKNGELFMDAFREFWAGNGKLILVEEQRVFGLSLTDLVRRLAEERGIKDPVVRKVEMEADAGGDLAKLRAKVSALRFKRVILVVPDYASRRFHAAFDDSEKDGKTIYLVRPVSMSYFTKERWWRNAMTRRIVTNEVCGTLALYIGNLTGGKGKH